MEPTPATNETPQDKEKRLMDPARELGNARSEMLHLIMATKLFYPAPLYDATLACLRPITRELLDIFTSKDSFSADGLDRAQNNREQFSPLASQVSTLLRQRLDELKQLPD